MPVNSLSFNEIKDYYVEQVKHICNSYPTDILDFERNNQLFEFIENNCSYEYELIPLTTFRSFCSQYVWNNKDIKILTKRVEIEVALLLYRKYKISMEYVK